MNLEPSVSPGRTAPEPELAARERRRSVLIDPPYTGPEPPGFLREHGVQLDAVAVIRRGESFRVLVEATP